MKLNMEQMAVIEKYVDADYIDKERLVDYLEKHKLIKNDVFKFCTKLCGKKFRLSDEAGYSIILNDEHAYQPVDRDTFIRRIPFYFYVPREDAKHKGRLHTVMPIRSLTENVDNDYLEKCFAALEFMFYDMSLSCYSIFNYLLDQTITPHDPSASRSLYDAIAFSIDHDDALGPKDLFLRWSHYLHLCCTLGWTDYMPERFITKYNQALEASGLEPFVYSPIKQLDHWYFTREEDNSYQCEGNFPCDDNGTPIMRWIGIRVREPKTITFDADKSRCGILKIALSPKTTIHALNIYEYVDDDPDTVKEEDDEFNWHQIYAGPLTMWFNHDALKEYRKLRNMTQQELAYAVGASVRTYQKWESGDTTPDGHYLLRLMNWLNINDTQELINYYDEDYDEGE